MTPISKALDALFGNCQHILFATHLEPERWWTFAELAAHCGAARQMGRATAYQSARRMP